MAGLKCGFCLATTTYSWPPLDLPRRVKGSRSLRAKQLASHLEWDLTYQLRNLSAARNVSIGPILRQVAPGSWGDHPVVPVLLPAFLLGFFGDRESSMLFV